MQSCVCVGMRKKRSMHSYSFPVHAQCLILYVHKCVTKLDKQVNPENLSTKDTICTGTATVLQAYLYTEVSRLEIFESN